MVNVTNPLVINDLIAIVRFHGSLSAWLHACKRDINGGKTNKIQLYPAELCFVEPRVMQRLQKLKFAIE